MFSTTGLPPKSTATAPVHDPVPDLDAQLLAAHEAADKPALARLYSKAADAREAEGDTEAACFYLVHAFVFALEAGAPEEAAIQARLAAHGREVPTKEHP